MRSATTNKSWTHDTHIYQSACQKRFCFGNVQQVVLSVTTLLWTRWSDLESLQGSAMSWLPQVWLACCLIAAACTHRARCSPSPPPAVVHALSQRGSHTFTVTTNHGRDASDWMWEGIRHSYQLCDYYKDTNKHRATMWSGENGERRI